MHRATEINLMSYEVVVEELAEFEESLITADQTSGGSMFDMLNASAGTNKGSKNVSQQANEMLKLKDKLAMHELLSTAFEHIRSC